MPFAWPRTFLGHHRVSVLLRARLSRLHSLILRSIMDSRLVHDKRTRNRESFFLSFVSFRTMFSLFYDTDRSETGEEKRYFTFENNKTSRAPPSVVDRHDLFHSFSLSLSIFLFFFLFFSVVRHLADSCCTFLFVFCFHPRSPRSGPPRPNASHGSFSFLSLFLVFSLCSYGADIHIGIFIIYIFIYIYIKLKRTVILIKFRKI